MYKICLFSVEGEWYSVFFKESGDIWKSIAYSIEGHENYNELFSSTMKLISKNREKYEFSFYSETTDWESLSSGLERYLEDSFDEFVGI